jgi:hypothetical protein
LCCSLSEAALLALTILHYLNLRHRLANTSHRDMSEDSRGLARSPNVKGDAWRESSELDKCTGCIMVAAVALGVGQALLGQTLEWKDAPYTSAMWVPYHGYNLQIYFFVFVAHAVALMAAFLAVNRADGQLELRYLDEPYHIEIQRLKILVILSITQMVLSAVVLLSTSDGGGPTGSMAVMLLIVGVTRSGRGLVLFLLYGWDRAAEDVENVKDCLRRAGVLPTSNEWPPLLKVVSRQYSQHHNALV